METVRIRDIEVITIVSNLSEGQGLTNKVSIYLNEDIEELVEDRRGMILSLGSNMVPLQTNPHICLLPHSFSPSHLIQPLHDQGVPFSQYLGLKIALDVIESRLNDKSLREPFFVSVNVNYIKERRRLMILPRVGVSASLLLSSRGASEEVFQRLIEEQRVESTDLEEEEESCSVCMEKLSEKIIIRMPRCLHMFHQDCLFEWLGRQNSCPMCRSVPYEKVHGTETQRLALGP